MSRDAGHGHFRSYWREGFQVVSGLFTSDDVETWDEECDRLSSRFGAGSEDPRLHVRRHGTKDTIVDRIDPVIDVSPIFGRLAKDERLRSLARDLLRSEVLVMKDRLIMKRPGTHGYGLHQDFPYWESCGVPADELVSVMVSIDAADEENGAIEVFPGLHGSRLPGPSDEPRDVDPASLEGAESRPVPTAAGDVLLMHPLTPHRSAPNRSSRSRRMVSFIYVPERHDTARALYYSLRS